MDKTAPKELQKSALKFLKIVITFLSFAEPVAAKELTSLILTHVFSLENSAKYTMIIRKILNKLISRVGLPTVLACTAPEHHALVNYTERCRRKAKNAKERAKFAMGQSGKDQAPATGAAVDDSDGDESSGSDDDDEVDVMDQDMSGAALPKQDKRGEDGMMSDDSSGDDDDDEGDDESDDEDGSRMRGMD